MNETGPKKYNNLLLVQDTCLYRNFDQRRTGLTAACEENHFPKAIYINLFAHFLNQHGMKEKNSKKYIRKVSVEFLFLTRPSGASLRCLKSL
jgi:hypothetical protein